MKKPILLFLSLLLSAVVASAGNVVTYSYDSAGNRITKVVSAPAKGSGSESQLTARSSSSGGQLLS